jgi:hypothetical protein
MPQTVPVVLAITGGVLLPPGILRGGVQLQGKLVVPPLSVPMRVLWRSAA